MIDWNPELGGRPGPTYAALAEALADDIDAGRLRPGVRLPTQRALASRLGVTVGTVGRAYAEAERRQLVSGEVGRGTFVRARRRSSSDRLRMPDEPSGVLELSMNHPPFGLEEERSLTDAMAALVDESRGRPGALAHLTGYQPPRGSRAHRRAAAAWIGRVLPDPDPERIALTAGAQHGMACVLSALARPGDVLLVEELTFPGVLVLADRLGLRLEPVAMDHQGILPDALERACRTHAPRALYAIPTLQNPTVGLLSDERRRAVARILQQHDAWLVEDDVHGALPRTPCVPIAAYAPERSFYLSNTAKTLSPGLRIGFVHAPDEMQEPLALAIQASVWMAPPLGAELFLRWVQNGDAARILEERRLEVEARVALARELLPSAGLRVHPQAFHAWLELPRAWSGEALVAAAARQGVRLSPGEAFEAVAGDERRGVRVCLGAERERTRLRVGLDILARILAREPRRRMSVL